MNSYDRIYSLLLEWRGDHPVGKFTKKSPLTPQKHDLEGRTEKEETRANFRAMADALRKAHKEKKELAYGREGDVKGTRLERLVSRYAKRYGIPMKSFNLEHPDYDPNIPGNKAEKILARKHGKKTTKKGREYAFSRDLTKQDSTKAYPQTDHGAKEPSKYELVQRDQNRLTRRGVSRTVRDQEKKGRIVVGPYGAGHWRNKG